MVDPIQVEYLNYQDQVHHNVTDGRYDDQHIPDDVVPMMDQNDIAATATPAALPLQPPFPGGSEDTSLLHSYAYHVALPLWYNSDNVRIIFNCLKLSYTTEFKCFNYYINFYMCFCLIIFFMFEIGARNLILKCRA